MPVILKPLQYANTATWNGSGTSTVTVNFGFQPDLVWIKPRNNVASNANGHILIDSVRGVDKVLRSHTTGAEVTESNNITAFTSTGITIGDSHNVNKNTTSQYVAWAWQKGATQGFDIVTFTGDGSSPKNIAHSLGVAPRMMIFKSRNNVSGWNSYHASLGNTQQINLQTTAAAVSSVDWWNNTSPTSSQFTIGANLNINGYTFVAYLFSEVAGFSKFGSYTGNGSTDGPFVYLGFRPRWIMWKRSDSTSDWEIVDAERPTRNVVTGVLYANLSNAEATSSGECDFVSNGFKIRDNSNRLNTNGGTYIYMAFAEAPFKNALAR